jgi:hypothetical protein
MRYRVVSGLIVVQALGSDTVDSQTISVHSVTDDDQ